MALMVLLIMTFSLVTIFTCSKAEWIMNKSITNDIEDNKEFVPCLEQFVQEFINFTLHYIADLDIPIKR